MSPAFITVTVWILVPLIIIGLVFLVYGIGARRKTASERQPTGMNQEEIRIIKAYAAGDSDLRDRALAIYRAYLPTLRRTTPEMRFMSEVDHPVPDLALRSRYRRDLEDK